MVDHEVDAEGIPAPMARGRPLVATPLRWAAGTTAVALLLTLAAQAYIALSHAEWSLSSFWEEVAAAVALLGALLWATLRAEELRLARELRTARTGTSVLRAMLARRRQGSPLARLVSSGLGTAAVVLADGDRSDALAALARGSRLMRGGRLEKLRWVVEADLERSTGAAADLERCAEQLGAMPLIGNREADLYRTHVLVKALLEQGDADRGIALAERLARSRDDEERVYRIWLHTWFDVVDASERSKDAHADTGPPVSEGELRRATLLARAHGAGKLVERLEERLAAIARSEDRK